MRNLDIIRTWKDQEYRDKLLAEDSDKLVQNPAGIFELDDETLLNINGGTGPGTTGKDGCGFAGTAARICAV